ncbi:hypothetical protein NP493_1354g00018 [Ridgeia piscesae]|uniref:Uncharacterized protein n=1 Tax=Ridgeia piscesae TaxID=27915 RepID=A0AAD9ND44_RIDPI|nr:hypothetical protein NP493_1354g00018 [Ridgeia piscesae]
MELARRRDEGKSRHLPPVAHTAASVTNQRGDKQEKTKATCRTIDVTNTGRVTQRQHNKDRSDMHRPLGRRRDYDRLSIGSPIPAILPQDEETDNRELGVSSPFPAIKVSSCGELRSTLTTASEEELLTSSTAVSAGLLRLSTPLYRRSTDGRYLQHFTSGDLLTSRSEGDVRTTSATCRGKSVNPDRFDDLTRSHDLVSCQLLKLDIGSGGRSKGQNESPRRKPPQRLVPIRYSATAVNTPP